MNSKSVLVIDDNRDVLEVLEEVLVDNEFNVTTASTGLEALSMINDNQFDIVISDIVLGHLNGDKIVNIIKDRSPNTQIILMSGVDAYKDQIQDFCSFIKKPIDFDELLKLFA